MQFQSDLGVKSKTDDLILTYGASKYAQLQKLWKGIWSNLLKTTVLKIFSQKFISAILKRVSEYKNFWPDFVFWGVKIRRIAKTRKGLVKHARTNFS